MASASATAPDIGRTITVSALIAPSSSSSNEVASLDLLVADPGLEHKRVIAGIVGADLTHVAEVFEHRDDGFQNATQCRRGP